MERARAILERARTNCKCARVWVKSALLEWENSNYAAEEALLKEGIQLYPECDKLHMMLGQLYYEQHKIEDTHNAYRYFHPPCMTSRTGILRCPFSSALWILYVRLELEHTSLIKARSLLEVARQKISDSEDLWLESIQMERQAGNEALANQLLAKARQKLPHSGRIWSESIKTIPKIQRRTYISSALKEREDDPYIILSAGKLFWSLRKIPNARVWLRRAVSSCNDNGDFWSLLYVFELQNGTVEQQNEVIQDCVHANPHHGSTWAFVRKQKENRRKTIPEIIKLVAEQMKDVITEFEK